MTLRAKLVAVASLISALLVSSVRPASAAPIYTFQTLDVPGANATDANGINNTGQIVGFYAIGQGAAFEHGFVLSGGIYTSFDVPGAAVRPGEITNFVNGINDAGQIVGYYLDASVKYHGFLLNGGNYISFDVPGATGSYAQGINDAGKIVGWYGDTSASNLHGFLLSGGSYTSLNVPGAAQTYANGINNTGQIVGTYFDVSGGHGFTFSDGTYTPLNFPGARITNVNGINNAGQIVGTYIAANDVYHGFLLDGGIYTSLDVPGAIRASAEGINDAAQIVGSYEDAQFRNHGFLATAVPEPSSLTLFGVGVLGFAGYGWLRRGKRGSFLFHEDRHAEGH